MPDKELAPEHIVALSKLCSETKLKVARKLLKDGKNYPVDFGVKISGQLIVGHESTFNGSAKPSATDLVKLLLAKFGPKVRMRIVDELLEEHKAATKPPADEDGEVMAAALELLAARLIEGLTSYGPAKRAGAVTGDFKSELIEWTGNVKPTTKSTRG